jgi:hypothetical protein
MPSGSTNIQQWNPTAANQESDTAYTADTLRSGGAVDPSVFPSITANKLFYQLSTFIVALANALAAKGYVVSDANVTTLAGVLANIITQTDLSAALALYATLASPALTGAPTTTTLATTALDANGASIRIENGGNPAALLRNDGTSFSVLTTPAGSPGYNTLRPFFFNLLSGLVSIDNTGAGISLGGAAPIANAVTVPTPSSTDNSLRAANTNWIQTLFAPLANANLTGSVVIEGASPTTQAFGVGNGYADFAAGAIGNFRTGGGSSSDNSTNLPNTAWVQTNFPNLATAFLNSLTGLPGYQKFPGGLVLQWGETACAGSSSGDTVTYGISFPTTCMCVVGCDGGVNANVVACSVSGGTSFKAYCKANGGTWAATGVHWIAIGY